MLQLGRPQSAIFGCDWLQVRHIFSDASALYVLDKIFTCCHRETIDAARILSRAPIRSDRWTPFSSPVSSSLPPPAVPPCAPTPFRQALSNSMETPDFLDTTDEGGGGDNRRRSRAVAQRGFFPS